MLRIDYIFVLSILQQRKELLRTFEGQKWLLERACEACSGKENELNHLEEQINHMVQQVGFIITRNLKSLYKKVTYST